MPSRNGGKVPQELPKKLYEFLKGSRQKKHSIEELSDKFDCGVSTVKGAIESLHKEGKNIFGTSQGVQLASDIPKSDATIIDQRHLVGKTIRMGFLGDTHLASKYARLDVLNALYDIYANEGITNVYHTGNPVDGECRFNKYDLVAHGIEGQTAYFLKHYPQRKGVKTSFVTGDDHEGWWTSREGINWGRYAEQEARSSGRNDLVYLGHMEHDIKLQALKGSAVMRIAHPGGGSAYATSYTQQKIVESYQGGEKPHILALGHYHKAEYGFPREVHCIQTGCTQDQTAFMRKKKIQAHVGGWIVELQQGENGIIQRFRSQWIPFLDKGYYAKAWRYRWE